MLVVVIGIFNRPNISSELLILMLKVTLIASLILCLFKLFVDDFALANFSNVFFFQNLWPKDQSKVEDKENKREELVEEE